MSGPVSGDRGSGVGRAFKVTFRGKTLIETDDWVDALWTSHEALMTCRRHELPPHVTGVHPTHDFGNGVLLPGEPEFKRADHRCRDCGAYDNGSYGSQASCGYDFSGDSLVSALERERAAHR